MIFNLIKIGYIHEGDKGIKGREAFKAKDEIVENLPEHHLYLCAQDCHEILKNRSYRDYLRVKPAVLMKMNNLKLDLVESRNLSRAEYIEGKSETVNSITLDAIQYFRRAKDNPDIIEFQIQEMVDKETIAWSAKDSESLVTLFHEDMVWPWPPSNKDHDPEKWILTQGRCNEERWKVGWQSIFDAYELVRNIRKTIKIEVSKEKDGAFAVVDVDTLWRHLETKEIFHWLGRACKGYSKVNKQWKLIMHTGLLQY